MTIACRQRYQESTSGVSAGDRPTSPQEQTPAGTIAQQERPDGHRRPVPGAAPSGNGGRQQVRMAPFSEFDIGGTRESPRKDRTGDPRSASPSAPLAEQPSLRDFAFESHTIGRRSHARDHPLSGPKGSRMGPAGPAKQLAMEGKSHYAAISGTPAKRCLRAAPADRDIAFGPVSLRFGHNDRARAPFRVVVRHAVPFLWTRRTLPVLQRAFVLQDRRSPSLCERCVRRWDCDGRFPVQ